MSSTAGTPPSPMVHLPPLSPEQPKTGILINPDEPARRPSLTIPTSPVQPSAPSPGAARIRFAPLPDPRPRSLSTGRNIGWTSSVDDDGNETRHMEVRNIPQSSLSYDTDEAISDGEDDDRRMRGRSWSRGMESSWKISKKILTVGMWDDKEEKTYEGGMPLKKSVSTGGMIGRQSMQGLPIPASTSHRRMSSLDPATSPLATSPTPVKVKLMNGRVYGARRASELAELQKKQREAAEPEFVEWGNGGQGAVAAVKSSGRGLLGDDDDGSGMEWVKRRREERQRREAEKKQEAPKLLHTNSSPEAESTLTPALSQSPLPPTPIIQISEPVSPTATATGQSEAIDIQPKAPQAGGDVFEDESEEEDDGDFSDDDEEEEEAARTTSSAAGIEIMSRHHH